MFKTFCDEQFHGGTTFNGPEEMVNNYCACLLCDTNNCMLKYVWLKKSQASPEHRDDVMRWGRKRLFNSFNDLFLKNEYNI